MTENRDEIPEEVVVPIEDSIDLHPFRPNEIRSVVESYLEEALAAGFSEVRLIHGRGIGVQREIIRSLLSRHPRVDSYRDAPSERGGWGATVVRLTSGGSGSD
jgi:dsDNA-specific endonuclease/ATPase MutS2